MAESKENFDTGTGIPVSLAEEKAVLDNIESSVQALQARIQYLLKEQSKNRKKLQSAFHSSLETVEHKLQQASQYHKVRNMKRTKDRLNQDSQNKVKLIKEKQQEEFMAVKESLFEIKREEHENIKEMSRKNRKLIEDSRKDIIDKKRQNVTMMKMEKEISKNELARMAEERKQQLKQARIDQHKKNEEKKRRLAQQIQQMENTEKQLVQAIRKTSQNVNQFTYLKKVTGSMSIEQFESIVKEVKSKEKEAIKEGRTTEKILEYVLKYRTPQQKRQENTVQEKKDSPHLVQR